MKYTILFLFIFLYGCGNNDQTQTQPLKSVGEPYVVECTQPLPIFTLGRNSNPTQEQEKALCECIWENLGKWEREVSEKIAQGGESEISQMHSIAFPSRFGSAMKKCGGMEL